MMNGGLSRLKESYVTLKKSEQKAARYTLDYPDQMVQMTVSELAEASGSSRSAIIRLCKTLGLKGYQELRLCVAGDLQALPPNGDAYKEIQPNSDIETIIASVSNNAIFSINETLKILDHTEANRAINWLDGAHRIDFYGSGASQLVAHDALVKFMRINRMCTAYADSHLQMTSAVTLTERDVAVAISYSGETLQTVECLKAAKAAGAHTVAITGYGSNTLGRLADAVLTIVSTESDVRSAATASRIVQLNVIDMLYLAVVSRNYQASLDCLNRSRVAIHDSFRLK
ncbi:MAG: MurR/RpiR family transcriptional regulator [Sporolactobacillus sp.]